MLPVGTNAVITCATVRINLEDNNDLMMGNSHAGSYYNIPSLDRTCVNYSQKIKFGLHIRIL
jgi:hypothetical protein